MTLALGAHAGEEATRLKLSTELSAESRYFMHNAAFPQQRGSSVSVAVKPEVHFEWDGGDWSFTLTPFARWDQFDEERTHADLREAYLRHRAGPVEIRAGIRTVFWGVTESAHLVNVINQTDAVENPDGEDKLGQPMLNAVWNAPFGDLEVFVLPYFRERLLPGPEGRLRGPVPFDQDNPIYESGAEEEHVDGAARWSINRGGLDLGLSWFKGTNRAPRFALDFRPTGPLLVPVYDQIEQTGIDANYVMDGWLLKLESIYQDSRAGHFTAAAGGFEYTLSGVMESAVDVGLLAEVLWDDRDQSSPSPFQRDLFVGTRIAANDEHGTELLAGCLLDLQQDSLFANLEASRRIGDSAKIVIEMRLFEKAGPSEPLFLFRQDDYVQVEFIQYF